MWGRVSCFLSPLQGALNKIQRKIQCVRVTKVKMGTINAKTELSPHREYGYLLWVIIAGNRDLTYPRLHVPTRQQFHSNTTKKLINQDPFQIYLWVHQADRLSQREASAVGLRCILSFRVGGRQGCGHSVPNCHKNAKSYPSYLGACDYPRLFGSGPEPFQLSTIFGILTSCIGEHGCSIFFWACQLTVHWLRHQWIIHWKRINPESPGCSPFIYSLPPFVLSFLHLLTDR